MSTEEGPNPEPPPVPPADGTGPNRRNRVVLKMKLKRHTSDKHHYYTTMESTPEEEEKNTETELNEEDEEEEEVSDPRLKQFLSWLSEGGEEGHLQVAEPEDVFDSIRGFDEGHSEWEESSDGEQEITSIQEIERKRAVTHLKSMERENKGTESIKVKQDAKWDSEPEDNNRNEAEQHFKPAITQQEISDLTGCRHQSLPERLRLSEERLGKGSPLCEQLREQIVEQFKNSVPQRKIAKNLGISSSTVHNIIKRFRESGQISVRKGQGRKPILTGCDIRVLRQHCIENKLDSVVEVTAWAQKHFGKTVSVNTVRRCIHKC